MDKEKKIGLAGISIIIGVVITVLSFISIFTSVRFILENPISTSNFIAYIVLSLVLGMISGIFYYFKFQMAFIVFITGILIGFIQMFRMFINGLDGWGDLAGFLSLLTWIIIGFILGIAMQFFQFLCKKFRK